MNPPLVSICIPTYNRAPFLKECLDSISRQFVDCEVKDAVDIFILDNQSKDNTSEVVGEFTQRFDNINYIIDSEKQGLVKGIISAAKMGGWRICLDIVR